MVSYIQQAGRSRVRFPMGSFRIFIDLILPWSSVRLSFWEKWVPGISRGGGGLRWPVRTTDNLATFMCHCLEILGASTSWSPKGLCRPVMRYLYLHLYVTSRRIWVVYLVHYLVAFPETNTTFPKKRHCKKLYFWKIRRHKKSRTHTKT
jgi:hypothetical protein